MLVLVMSITVIPANGIVKAAETRTSSIEILGNLGTVKIGDKQESGQWVKTKVIDGDGNEDEVFCMDLGKACHTGYVYTATEGTISSSSSNTKNSLTAKIGYWYAVTREHNNKAWVYAQCLVWAVEEGLTSKNDLTSIIRQVRTNTGYYNNKTAAELYTEIFDIGMTVTCKIKTWNYSKTESDDYVQRLLWFDSDKIEPEYKSLNEEDTYKQELTIQKKDESGVAMPGASFSIQIANYKQLENWTVVGGSGQRTSDDTFVITDTTNANGELKLTFTYKIQSQEYYYYQAKYLDDPDYRFSELKAALDDNGYKYGSDLTRYEAQFEAYEDLQNQINAVSNDYTITELSSNDIDVLVKADFSGSNMLDDVITKLSDSSCKVTMKRSDYNYGVTALILNVIDDFKKATITVHKVDKDTGAYVPQGNGALDGAEYRLFDNSACTQWSQVYDANGNKFTPGTYVIRNGKLVTDYLECGKKYYLKEVKAPTGYNLDPTVHEILESGANFTQEFNAGHTYISREEPVKGQVEIIKKKSYPTSSYYEPEPEAVFQIYLKSAGSYDRAKETERDILYADEEGYAISKKLPYGTYVVHQLDGDERTEFVADFDVVVAEHGKIYRYPLVNMYIPVFLKIVKKDLRTGQTVMKPNTTYQIYAVDRKTGEESLVTQTYYNGTEVVSVSEFSSDETGEIITPNKLLLGKYKIKEIGSAEGLHNSGQVLDIEITKTSYETKIDEYGNEYNIAIVEYFNDETKGKLSLAKTGEVLTDVAIDEDGNKTFVYEEKNLKNIVIEISAKEDIVTQDNQGTNWFDAGDKVATITTGVGAVFEDDCNGLCTWEIDEENGNVTVYLPLGKYEVKEVQTNYGYILDDTVWDIEFTWSNQEDAYVLNSTEATDEDGVLNIKNDRAKTDISIEKKDSVRELGVPDTIFGYYTKNNIYSYDGKLLVEAGEKLTEVKTDEKGKASMTVDVPLMSEGYDMDAEEEDANEGLNSGDYYFIEESISTSYYLDDTPIDVHLEYEDDETPIIKAHPVQKNVQSISEFSKLDLVGSKELKNCELKISEGANDIITWTSGNSESIKITDKAVELGYINLYAEMNPKGNLLMSGLKHDVEYVMSETKPEAGYVTAESITFKLVQDEDDEENVITTIMVKDGDGKFVKAADNIVKMFDDVTRVELYKTDITGTRELAGNYLELSEKDTGIVIDSWISCAEPHVMIGKLVVGKTYILKETRPLNGYSTASSIEFTVSDTGEVQKVVMKNDTTKVQFTKLASDTMKLLGGAKYKIYDSAGNEVHSFVTSGDAATMIEGILIAGETYTFVEEEAPDNYEVADDVTITLKDTSEVQTIEVIDQRKPGKIITEIPEDFTDGWDTSIKSPKTGYGRHIGIIYMIMLGAAGTGVWSWRKRKYADED